MTTLLSLVENLPTGVYEIREPKPKEKDSFWSKIAHKLASPFTLKGFLEVVHKDDGDVIIGWSNRSWGHHYGSYDGIFERPYTFFLGYHITACAHFRGAAYMVHDEKKRADAIRVITQTIQNSDLVRIEE